CFVALVGVGVWVLLVGLQGEVLGFGMCAVDVAVVFAIAVFLVRGLVMGFVDDYCLGVIVRLIRAGGSGVVSGLVFDDMRRLRAAK
ncbi:hypothetical protein, partial [Pseudomonas syringae group genomosp. 7]|uniref:hypothetical protein n=1 Tax=Pseudomonas syringae group genomosp. 7 TaxID=251699 RepID=UPI00376FFA1F